MRTNGLIFSGMALFFAIVTPAYWLLSNDPTGTVALLLTFGLTLMLGFYLLFVARRIGGLPPEDRADGEVYEAAGEYGFFSPKSWTPLYAAGGAAVLVLGLVFGFWLALIGVALLLGGTYAFVMEHYRGEWAH